MKILNLISISIFDSHYTESDYGLIKFEGGHVILIVQAFSTYAALSAGRCYYI
jgi:hypothetical protein